MVDFFRIGFVTGFIGASIFVVADEAFTTGFTALVTTLGATFFVLTGAANFALVFLTVLTCLDLAIVVFFCFLATGLTVEADFFC